MRKIPPQHKQDEENSEKIDTLTSSFVGRLNQPVVLRLPRGFAILAGLAVVGLVVLSFFVGQDYGQKNSLNSLSANNLQNSLRDNSGNALAIPQADFKPLIVISEENDPRVVGLRYYILASYNKALALKLHKFLAAHKVETFIKPRYNHQAQPRRFLASL